MKGVAGADEPAEVISIPNLIKHLCTLVAQPEVDRVVHLPSYRRKVINNFLNIAYEQLLGLRPVSVMDNQLAVAPDHIPALLTRARTALQEEAPEINDTDDLDHLVADGLSTVTSALHSDGFPELAASLASLLHRLSACTSCTVTGTPLQTITGKPPVVRMPDRTSLLTFLLELQGTCPSVRRRQSSFQQAWEARQLEKTSVEYDPMHITLRSNVFSEAPDPEALFHVSGTSVLLPQEGGGASAAAVGDADQLADLDTCLETRPVWAPTAAEGLPTKQGGGWLPIPHSLAQLQGDPRRHAPATPLRVPIGVLATDASPGAGTAFQAFKDQQTGTSPSVSRPLSARKPGQGSPIKVAAAARRQAAAEQEEAARRKAACSRGMWTGEEIDLARDAILSLQGVHSALMRLHGVLAAPHALPRPAAAGLLRSVQRAARVRQGLESFVAAHSGTGYVSGRMEVFNTDVTGEEGTSSAPGPGYDPVLVAFASAVGDLLRQLTEELSSLELLDGGSTSGGAPGPSLLHVAAGTREVQAELHTLGTLCWCTQAPGSAGLWTWEVTPPPTGTALLQYLYHQEQAAEGKLHTMVQYLFLRAVQPYTHALHRCAFTTSCLTGEDVYLTYAPPGWLDLGPSEAASSEQSGLRRRRRATLVPGPLPAFLADWQGPLLHASSQLRLLQTVECARDFVATLLALAPPPVALVQGSKSSREDGRWLLLGQSALDPGHGSVQGMSSEALHAAIASAAVDDAARAEAVDTWLEGLAKDRKEAENRERRAALDVLERLRGER